MNYKSLTSASASYMNVSGSVHWEWITKWRRALKYFEKFAADLNSVITGFFLVNVPFVFNIDEIFKGDDWKVLNKRIVLFKSREWRGCTDDDDKRDSCKAPKTLAHEINNYKKGTITSFYLTSDGGLDLGCLYELVGRLDLEKVVIVTNEELVGITLAAEKSRYF